MNEHVIDDLDAYALGALTETDAERVAAHVSECYPCRAEASALAEVVSTLPDAVPSREPSAALRDRLLAAARAGAVVGRRPSPVPWSLGRVRLSRVGLAALVAAVVVLGAVDLDAYRRLDTAASERNDLYATLEGLRQGGRWWYMAGKDAFAGAGGTLVDPRADGYAPFVLFHDLPPVASGKVLTVWLVSPDSTWARAASFHPNGRDLQAVPITMEVSGFDRCAVTLEDSSWGARSGQVVMESRIATAPTPAVP